MYRRVQNRAVMKCVSGAVIKQTCSLTKIIRHLVAQWPLCAPITNKLKQLFIECSLKNKTNKKRSKASFAIMCR